MKLALHMVASLATAFGSFLRIASASSKAPLRGHPLNWKTAGCVPRRQPLRAEARCSIISCRTLTSCPENLSLFSYRTRSNCPAGSSYKIHSNCPKSPSALSCRRRSSYPGSLLWPAMPAPGCPPPCRAYRCNGTRSRLDRPPWRGKLAIDLRLMGRPLER